MTDEPCLRSELWRGDGARIRVGELEGSSIVQYQFAVWTRSRLIRAMRQDVIESNERQLAQDEGQMRFQFSVAQATEPGG